MKAIGKMTCSMDLEKKYGLMDRDMKESTLRERNMGRVHMFGLMEVNTQETGLRIE
jgi:hypothetical protein